MPKIVTLGTLFAVTLGGALEAQVQFVDVSGASGIGPYVNASGMNAGVAVGDYDSDGDSDFFVPNGLGVADQLYRNLGGGQFEEIAPSLGLASTHNNRGALWVDFDGDGDLDLLVAADDFQQSSSFVPSTLTLYRQNGDGTFTDVTLKAGLFGALNDPVANPDNHLGGLAAADLDNDGFLELLVTFWRGYSFLYHNQGDGTFVESTAIARPFETYWQPAFADFDRDGFQDLFMAVDFHHNFFFHNQGDGTFVEVAGLLGMQNEEQNDMGVALGDVDNDGDLDIFVSNVYGGSNRRNHLYRNDSTPGVPDFAEVAIPAGVADAAWGWGATFADIDNDSHLDLAVTNGFLGDIDASRMFHHLGDDPPAFADVAATTGFDDTYWGACLLSFDADRDGDLDFLQTCVDGPLRLLANHPDAAAEYLVVQPRMRSGNRFAIGSMVRVEAGVAHMSRPITAGTSLLCQEPAEAFFGLGSASIADRVTVEWPGGRRTVLTQVAAGQVLRVSDAVVFSDGFESDTTSSWR